MAMQKGSPDITVPEMAASCGRAFLAAMSSVPGYEDHPDAGGAASWEAAVARLLSRSGDTLRVVEAASEMEEAYRAACQGACPDYPSLAWQAAACHLFCLVNYEAEDGPVAALEEEWRRWAADRINGATK